MPERLEVLVEGGKATAGAPLGPALGPMGLNIVQVVKDINEKTRSFDGMKVPVTLVIDTKTKSYTIEVGTPPVSALIRKEVGAEKGSGEAGKTYVGSIGLKQILKIADIKKDALQGRDLKKRVMEIVGTCVSMGVKVEGKPPKEYLVEIQAGKHDKALAG
ncbi:MAG TPA: 50S ribosomal protein L11 [Thermoplasmata archaeon]|jgi:large subunit ribosomal protein L11|nr:50S ribosomal protein L11 [Thermoplasmata archaeon]